MKKFMIMLCTTLALGAVACDKPAEEPKSEPAVEAPKTDEPAEEPSSAPATDEAPAAKIEVAAAGAKIDPPVKPEQLPDGAWYCDMGTVHWAAMDKPADGKCPECGMELKQNGAAKPAADGHDHGDGDHDHAH